MGAKPRVAAVNRSVIDRGPFPSLKSHGPQGLRFSNSAAPTPENGSQSNALLRTTPRLVGGT
jgi:hypothetical protein